MPTPTALAAHAVAAAVPMLAGHVPNPSAAPHRTLRRAEPSRLAAPIPVADHQPEWIEDILASLFIASFAVCSYGQDFAPSTPNDPASGSAPADTVVITGSNVPAYGVEEATSATKTDTALLDTPQRVTVVPRQVLNDEGMLSLPEALNNLLGRRLPASFPFKCFVIYFLRCHPKVRQCFLQPTVGSGSGKDRF